MTALASGANNLDRVCPMLASISKGLLQADIGSHLWGNEVMRKWCAASGGLYNAQHGPRTAQGAGVRHVPGGRGGTDHLASFPRPLAAGVCPCAAHFSDS